MLQSIGLALPGLFIMVVIYLATLKIWYHVHKASKTLGKGLLTRSMNLILMATSFVVLHGLFQILSIRFESLIFRMISGLTLLVVPFILLYVVWTISIYTKELKDMAN